MYSNELNTWGVFNLSPDSNLATCAEEKSFIVSMERFLLEIEKKAYRMAQLATGNQSDALDIVQDTMFKLVEKYSDRPSNEWKPLFYRILQSKITDYFRKKSLHSKIFFWKQSSDADSETFDPIESASDFICPERELSGQRNVENILLAIKELPLRQQQCFLLRSWEGLSVKETADAMGCSEGSVKTHYSRAKEALKYALTESTV